jgi:MYXO-CTERM domain-containing protein
MTSLDRAKAFLASTGKCAALTVLPLAAAVVSAHAGSISPGLLYPSCSGGSGYTQGVVMGSGVEFTGSVTCPLDSVSFGVSGGAASFSTTETFPVSWDFNVAAPNGSLVTYDLDLYGFAGGGATVLQWGVTGGAFIVDAGNVDIVGSATIGPPSAQMTSYDLDLDFGVSSGTDPTVTINALDLNVSSVPEPSALPLALPGLGLLLLKRRKSAPRA